MRIVMPGMTLGGLVCMTCVCMHCPLDGQGYAVTKVVNEAPEGRE